MDYLVVGAGPAGLQLGYFLKNAHRDHLITEAGPAAGTFFRTFPRHRRLISVNKRHTGWDDPERNLRMDWNSLLSDDGPWFTGYSERYLPHADDMVRYLGDFAAAHRLPISYDTRITRIERAGPGFRAFDQRGRLYEAARVVVATGAAQPYVPGIPGIEHAEPYGEMSVDPRDFRGRRVLIIGRGNSGFETADNLIEAAAVLHVAGPGPIRMAWRTHYPGHLRAVNDALLDTCRLGTQNALLDGTVDRIERHADGYRVTFRFVRAGEVTKDIPYDQVIVCTGFRFDASIFAPDCRPELAINDRFPAQTAEWESVNVPGLYFAGTLMQVRDFKTSTGAFIQGFRYGVRALHRMLERKHHGVPWPSRQLPADPAERTDAVIERLDRTSALWQQFGFLADVLLPDGRYLEEVPLDYVRAGAFGPEFWTITLERGADPAGRPGTASFSEGSHLRPVVRHHRDGGIVAVHHMAENLENEWYDPVLHREPLYAFLGGDG